MLVSAAVCPSPPILVPDVASGAASELDDCRRACHAAIDAVLAGAPDLLVVLGGGPTTIRYDDTAEGTLRPVGVAIDVPLRPAGTLPTPRVQPPTGARLGLSLTVGAWLLAGHGWSGPLQAQQVAWDSDPSACATLGGQIAAVAPTVGLLVLADGSARRGVRAPGYLDPRAAPYDDALSDALAEASPEALMALDPVLADELMVAGRACLQVLAGAAGGGSWQGLVGYRGDPYGVTYLVATWLRSSGT